MDILPQLPFLWAEILGCIDSPEASPNQTHLPIAEITLLSAFIPADLVFPHPHSDSLGLLSK